MPMTRIFKGHLSGPDFNDIDIKEVVESGKESLAEDKEEALSDWWHCKREQ